MKRLFLWCFMAHTTLGARAQQTLPPPEPKPATQEQARTELPQLLTLHAKLAEGTTKARKAHADILEQEEQLARFGRELAVARRKLKDAQQQMAQASYIPSSVREPLQGAIAKQKQLVVILQRLLGNGNAMVTHLKAHLPVIAAKAEQLAGNVKKLHTQGSAVLGALGVSK